MSLQNVIPIYPVDAGICHWISEKVNLLRQASGPSNRKIMAKVKQNESILTFNRRRGANRGFHAFLVFYSVICISM